MSAQPFDYSEIALIDLLIKMGKGAKVADVKPIDRDAAFKTYLETINAPAIGSQWLNSRKQQVYTVHGLVVSCEDENDMEVLYRSDDMPLGQFWRRSIKDWHGNNRDGQPRFVKVDATDESIS